MNLDWQTWCAALIVMLAAAIVLRRLYRYLFAPEAGAGCGSCSSCPNKSASTGMQVTPLVQISAPSTDKSR